MSFKQINSFHISSSTTPTLPIPLDLASVKTMSKPAFVFVHGAWHTPGCWRKVTDILESQGYRTSCPALPSTHASPPIPDLAPDADAVRSAVTRLLDEGLEVVVVCHSYGGIPTCEGLRDLDVKSRKENNSPGGVIRLVYISAYMVPEGFQLCPTGTRDNLYPSMKTDLEVSYISVRIHE
jgi:pimeloyl-ACP methyl ester carboxylesterase